MRVISSNEAIQTNGGVYISNFFAAGLAVSLVIKSWSENQFNTQLYGLITDACTQRVGNETTVSLDECLIQEMDELQYTGLMMRGGSCLFGGTAALLLTKLFNI